MYLLRTAIFPEKLLLETANFPEKQYSATYFYRRGAFIQLHLLSTTTLLIYKLTHFILVSNIQ